LRVEWPLPEQQAVACECAESLLADRLAVVQQNRHMVGAHERMRGGELQDPAVGFPRPRRS
jgi:hypothetical protein